VSPAPFSTRPVPWLPILAIVGIALLVALTAPGAPVWTELRDGSADRAQALDRAVEMGVLGLFVVVATALVFRAVVTSRRPGSPPLHQTLLRAIPLTAVSLAVLVLLVLARTAGSPERGGGGGMQMKWFPGLGLASEQQATPRAFANGIPQQPGAGAAPVRRGLPPFLLALVIAVVAMVAVAALRYWRQTSPSPMRVVDPAEGASTSAGRSIARERLLSTIATMLAHPDPRMAVIGAYARLLASMEGHEGARLPFEAPREHLHRLLGQLQLRSEPLHRLVDLFEVARFSPHAVTEAQRQEALAGLRDALAGMNGALPKGAEAASGALAT
jgi:hypothetical protein